MRRLPPKCVGSSALPLPPPRVMVASLDMTAIFLREALRFCFISSRLPVIVSSAADARVLVAAVNAIADTSAITAQIERRTIRTMRPPSVRPAGGRPLPGTPPLRACPVVPNDQLTPVAEKSKPRGSLEGGAPSPPGWGGWVKFAQEESL